VLYAAPPAAPQLENRDDWFKAAPLLVSGTEAYERGEYLYQDHLYDDHGSDTGAGSSQGGAGDLVYPADRARYGDNAADLVEFRVSWRPDAVAYRITLNTLLAADSTIVAMAFDTDRRAETGVERLPRDPGAPFPGTDEVITIWGTGAEHTRFPLPAGSPPVTTALPVHTDLEANQLTVVVPRSVSDPRGRWRATVAVGLYDPQSGGWLQPQAGAGPRLPGGAGTLDPHPSGIFNLGFRFSEPVTGRSTPPDTAQAAALRAGVPTHFAHDLDFDALAAGVSRSTVPATGTQLRIFPSRLQLGEGRDPTRFPGYLGQLQPYSLTVPSSYRPGVPAPLTLDLHSLGEHHWQYHGSTGLRQLGEERSSLVLTPLARGVDGWYQHEAEYDVFEAWNDVARHFSVDAERVAVAGYSMGGYGTYRLATLYPDLFGAAMTVVGPPAEGVWLPPLPPSGGLETLSNRWLEGARHVPFLNVVAGEDQLVPLAGTRAQSLGAPELGVRGFDQLGYRFRFVVYSPADHTTLARLGYDIPLAAPFLSEAAVERRPSHVSFVYDPGADDAALGLVHDHAYWVSGLRLGGTGAGRGVIEAVSHASGRGDPGSQPGRAAGTEPLPYVEVNRSWGDPPETARENRLTVSLDDLAAARLDLAGAGLDPGRELTVEVTANLPSELFLAGAFPVGSVVRADGKVVSGAVVTDAGLRLVVGPGPRMYTISPG
jgi:dienelactone hydrolase